MTFKYVAFFSFTALSILLNTSCKKNSVSTPPDSGGSILDKEVWLESTSGGSSTLQYRYNSSGNLITISSGHPNGGDTLTYTADGKLSRYKAGNAWEVAMVYDSNGLITGVKKTSMQGFGRVFAYDGKGRVVADSSLDDMGKVVYYYSYAYDNDDNIISYKRTVISQSGGLYFLGPVTVTYDHHPNPHAKFGNWIYYGVGDFRYLFKENSISEKNGSIEEKNPPDLVYKYYSDGQLWQASSHSNHFFITYYYKLSFPSLL